MTLCYLAVILPRISVVFGSPSKQAKLEVSSGFADTLIRIARRGYCRRSDGTTITEEGNEQMAAYLMN